MHHLARLPLGAALAAILLAPPAARAQTIRGTVKAQDGGAAVPAARVSAYDSLGTLVAEVETDADGTFTLRLGALGTFRIGIRRIGYQPSSSDLVRADPRETLELEFLIPADRVALDTVNVRARDSQNTIRFRDAVSRGWRVYEPAEIQMHRDRARDFGDLIRSVNATGIIPPRSFSDCVRLARTNRCATIVLDDVVTGPTTYVNPNDVYFFAVLSPSEATVMYGDRGRNGAIAIYTRMNGDRYDLKRRP
jgi:hypothetical protein